MTDPAPALDHPVHIFVFINEGSGGSGKDIPCVIDERLAALGHNVTLVILTKGQDITTLAEPFILQAVEEKGLVVAAGGDGTVNTIAGLCYKHKALMGVLPLGTFNYFARVIGMPMQLEGAIDALSKGVVRKFSAGFVQDRIFLVNASFGLYPTIIRQREQAKSRFGRMRLVAVLSAVRSLLTKRKQFGIRLHHGGETDIYRTSMVFVGNNSFQLENLGLEASECARQNRLAVVIMKPMTRYETARIIWRGIVRNLKGEPRLQQFCADSFEVETKRPTIEIVVDGEIMTCNSPLAFRIEPEALSVIAPVEEPAAG